MMNHFAVWVDDLLGMVKEDPSPDTIRLIEKCVKGCASRRNALEHMTHLRNAASHCINRTGIVGFLNEQMPISFSEQKDTVLKSGCAGPVASRKYDSLHLTVVQDKKNAG